MRPSRGLFHPASLTSAERFGKCTGSPVTDAEDQERVCFQRAHAAATFARTLLVHPASMARHLHSICSRKGARPFRFVGCGTQHRGLVVSSIVPLLGLLLHWDYTFSAHVQTEVQDLTTAVRRGNE